MTLRFIPLIATVALAVSPLSAAIVSYSADGDTTTASITPTLNQFRTDLGGANNGTGPGPFVGGRREVNWDAVPAGSQAPTAFPGNFFNQATAGRARGLNMSAAEPFFVAPGVSAVPAFSAALIFGLSGTQLDITFSAPGFASTVATVSGFGVVLTDFDQSSEIAQMEVFTLSGTSLGVLTLPGTSDLAGSFAFMGMRATAGEQIGRVRLTLGNGGLFSNAGALFSGSTCGASCIGMDDFIYGEPVAAVPEPGAYLLSGLGLSLLALRRRFAGR
jgi:hypothetical protein